LSSKSSKQFKAARDFRTAPVLFVTTLQALSHASFSMGANAVASRSRPVMAASYLAIYIEFVQ
jgi:hypothetical protein